MKQGQAKAGSLKTLYRAMALFIVIVMIRPQDMFPVLGLIKPGLITTVLLFGAVIAHRKFEHLGDPIVRAFFFYIAVLVSTVIVVVNHNHWFWNLFSVVSYAVAYVIAMPALLRSEEYRWRIMRLILISFGVSAVYGISHDGVGPGDWLGDENDMACALSLGAAFAAGLGIASSRKGVRMAGWGIAVLCTLGIAVAGSRGGFLGFFGVALGLLYYSGRLWRSAVVAAVIALAAYPLIPTETKEDFLSISDSKDETRLERIYSWKKGMEMFVDSPLLGVGLGNYPWRIGDYQQEGPEMGRYWRPLAGRVAHSSYVTVLSESGVLGALPYAFIIVLILLRARSVIYRSQTTEDWQRALAIAGGAGMFGAGISAAFITFCYAPPLYLLAGVVIAASSGKERQAHKVEVPVGRAARLRSRA